VDANNASTLKADKGAGKALFFAPICVAWELMRTGT
jgi:hypothetical protein